MKIVVKSKRKLKPRGGIYYIICHLNDHCYVGSAKNLSNRFSEHKNMLNAGTHYNRHLQNAWKKYGEEAFYYQIAEEIKEEYSRDLFFAIENLHIDTLKTAGLVLYNIAKAEGGWGPTTHERVVEIGAKISATLKATAEGMTKEERSEKWGHWKGKKLTPEHAINTGAGLLGIKRSSQTRQKMKIAQKKRADNDPQVALNMAVVGRLNIGRPPVNSISIIFRSKQYTSVAALSSCNRFFKPSNQTRSIWKRLQKKKSQKSGKTLKVKAIDLKP